MSRLARILLLALSLAAILPDPDGARAQDGGLPPPAAKVDPRQAALMQAALGLRTQGVSNALEINQRFGEGGTVFPSVLPNVTADGSSGLWSLFFRKTQMIFGAENSETPIVGYYNSIVDCWLLTRWQFRGAVAKLAEAVPVKGNSLGKGGGERPRWALQPASMDMVQAMQSSATAAVAEFIGRYPPGSNRRVPLSARPDLPALIDRVASVYVTLQWLENDPQAARAVNQTLDSLAKGDGLKLSQQLDAQSRIDFSPFINGAAFRTRLEVSLVEVAEGGFLIWAGLPENGRWLLLAGYKIQPDGQFGLSRLAFVDLLQGGAK